ncbi:MAG: GAF domain-containing protein, partial [Anaerolineae bacterium]|nr:GAF domain-containing protein [Anaerolineae bacterium]
KLENWRLEILGSLIDQASDRIHSIEEHERTLDYLETLDKLVEAAKQQSSEEELLQLIAQQALELTYTAGERAHHCHIIKVVDDRYLQIGAVYPPINMAHIQSVLSEVDLQSTEKPIGITGLAITHREPIFMLDVKKNPNYIPFHPETQSEIAVPIFFGKKVHSVINVEHPQPGALKDQQLRLLMNLANHTSTALQIIPMFNRAQRYSKALEAISSAEQYLDIDSLLDAITQQVHLLVKDKGEEISYASIWLYNPESHTADVQATHPAEFVRYINAVNFGKIDLSGRKGRIGVVGRCILSKQPRLVLNPERDMDYVKSFPHTKSEVVVPILFRNSVIGAINAEHALPNAFDEVDVKNLVSFAKSAADAIISAQLRRALDQTAQAIVKESELNRLLPEIARQVYALTSASGRPARLCYVSLLKNQRLIFEAFHPRERFDDLLNNYPEIDLERDQIGINGHAALTGKSVLAKNVHDEEWQGIYIPYDPEVNCSLGVPIIIEGHVRGVITVEHTDVNAFGQYHCEILEHFATQAALAIKRAQEFEEAKTLRYVAEQLAPIENRDEVLRISLQGALRLTQSNLASIKFWDLGTETYGEAYKLESPVGELIRFQTTARAEGGYTRQVINSLERITIRDIQADPNVSHHIRTAGWGSMLLVPVVHRDQLAVVTLFSRHRHNFTAAQEELLVTLLSQTAIALDRVEQLQELRLLGPHNFASWWSVIKGSMDHRLRSDMGRSLLALDRLKIYLEKHASELDWVGHLETLRKEIRELEHILPSDFSAELRTIPINQFVQGFFQSVRHRPRFEHLTIELDLDPELNDGVTVLANDLLREVFTTIVENSSHALTKYQCGDHRLIVRTIKGENNVTISIRDHGPGIPNHVRAVLFRKPIEQSEGGGVGLWKARGFMQTMKGSLDHIQPADGGCEMVISVPLLAKAHY